MHQLRMSDICDRACKINHLSAKRWLIYITFALSQLNDYFYYHATKSSSILQNLMKVTSLTDVAML